MRVTSDSGYRDLLSDIQAIAERMQSAQSQISSGRKFNRPSEDPVAAADIVSINVDKGEIHQFLENVSTGRTRLQASDSALGTIEQLTERMLSLAELATSDAVVTSSYAPEVSGLISQIVLSANTTSQGQFIFAGSNTQTTPFVTQSDGTITYQGDSNAVNLQIGRNATLQTQIPGSDVFAGSLFTAMNDLVTALNSGDKAAIRASITTLDQFSSTLSSTRSRVGALLNMAQTAETDLKNDDLARTADLSRLQDADLSQALTEFSQSQTALQAATAVGARISNISILDYLK